MGRGPQSVQSRPMVQYAYSEPGPPSSHEPSLVTSRENAPMESVQSSKHQVDWPYAGANIEAARSQNMKLPLTCGTL